MTEALRLDLHRHAAGERSHLYNWINDAMSAIEQATHENPNRAAGPTPADPTPAMSAPVTVSYAQCM